MSHGAERKCGLHSISDPRQGRKANQNQVHLQRQLCGKFQGFLSLSSTWRVMAERSRFPEPKLWCCQQQSVGSNPGHDTYALLQHLITTIAL